MLTEKDYCDKNTCVALKEVGCDQHYDKYKETNSKGENIFDWFTLYEAQKWLREEKNIEVNASFDKTDDGWIAFIQRLDYPDMCGTDVFSTVYNTYESALLMSIKEAIKILKEENNENSL